MADDSRSGDLLKAARIDGVDDGLADAMDLFEEFLELEARAATDDSEELAQQLAASRVACNQAIFRLRRAARRLENEK